VLSKNRLKTAEDLLEVSSLDSVSVLDLANNNIDGSDVIQLLAQMKGLKVLTLTGNPITRNTKDYRQAELDYECK